MPLHFDRQTPGVVQPAPLPVSLDSALFSTSSPLSRILGKTYFSQGSPAGSSRQHQGADPDLAPRPSVQRLRSSCPARTKAWSPLTASSPGPGLRARFPFPHVMGRKTEVQRAPAQDPQGGGREGPVQRSGPCGWGCFLSPQESFPGIRWRFFPRAPPSVRWSGRN